MLKNPRSLASSPREPVKVVVHYTDGRVLKGTTLNFSASRGVFSLELADAADDDEPVSVRMADLKAVFFVRDLIGDAGFKELKAFEGSPAGRKIGLTFKDGEYLAGVSFTYDAARAGFFMFPADPRSNNERIYVVMSSVARVDKL